MDENKKILIIEDEEKLRSAVQEYLELSEYETRGVDTGTEALKILADEEEWPDLILLDLMLPGMSGFETLKKIREKSDIPTIILTARSSEEDQLKGFALGADDYLTKPFLLSVLKAHIKALLRRSGGGGSTRKRKYGLLTLDEEAHRVFLGKEEIELTPREYEVLYFMALNEGIVMKRDRILDEIWGIDYSGTDRAVDTIIKQLRLKLKHAGRYITTIYGIGYRFEVRDHENH